MGLGALAAGALAGAGGASGGAWAALAALAAWMVVVRLFRRRLQHHLEGLDPTKPADRKEIVYSLSSTEFTLSSRIALELGLFKTFAIPSISAVLHHAGEFEKDCIKRYDDTDLIVREIVDHGASSARGILARERLNYIHSHYKISNDDYLYTLSMFVVEPHFFVQKYDWRGFTKVEQDALYNLWKEVGEGMGIQNMPTSFDAMAEWSLEYERNNMRHAKSNVEVVTPTVKMLLDPLPKFVRPIALALIPAVMHDRLAKATGFPPAKPWAKFVANTFFFVRAILLKYFFLPRWTPMQRTVKGPLYGPDGKRRKLKTNWNVYGCAYPDGYDIADLGPKHMAPGKTCPLFKAGSGPRCTKE